MKPKSASFNSSVNSSNSFKQIYDNNRSSPESFESLEFLREFSDDSGHGGSIRTNSDSVRTFDGFSSTGSRSEYSGSLSPESFEFNDFSSLSAAYQYQQMQQRRMRKPPEGYLCHLCFCKGHYIKDCPEVGKTV